MVSADEAQLNNPCQYARFRDDQEAEEGFSKVLYHVDADPQYYDKLDEMPQVKEAEQDFVHMLYS